MTQPNKEQRAPIQAKTNKITDLVQKAKFNLDDLTEAEKIIEKKEHYNKATFAGMTGFVRKSEKELPTKRFSLNKKLANVPQAVNK